MWLPPSWDGYPPCHRCHVAAGKPCVVLGRKSALRKGDRRLRPHPGRRQYSAPRGRRLDEDVTNDRLLVWKRLAQRDVLVKDIAHTLGMTRAALDRFVLRARDRGHPDAIYHARAQSEERRYRTRRAQRRQQRQLTPL